MFADRKAVDVVISALIGLFSFALLLGTSRDFGMVWDEGWAIEARETLGGWFSWLWDGRGRPPRLQAFSRTSLEHFWPFSKEIPNTHPPGHVLLILAGWWPSHGVLGPLEASRLGPIALNSLGTSAVYFYLARRRGRLAGLAGASALILMPRSFALAHYAHCDMPLSVLWLFTQMAFLRGLESARWKVAFGVFLGLSVLTKFTGVFAFGPPLVWVALYEWSPRLRPTLYPSGQKGPRPPGRLAGTWALLVGGIVALLVIYAFQPPWWADPVDGVRRFLTASLGRQRVIPLPTYYLGRTYDFALPWHNTIVLTVATTPVLMLGLGLLGAGWSLRRARSEPWAVLWVLSWLILLIVRALPNAPGHDGIRLFLPSFASLAVLAGLGVGAIAGRFRGRWSFVAPVLGLAMTGEAVAEIARVYPYTDSYYSATVGGLPGAERLGFELTYFWEVLGPEFRKWLAERARRGPVEVRFQGRPVVVDYARKWNEWPPDVKIAGDDPTEKPLYVLMRRLSIYSPADRALDGAEPSEFAISRRGVDLLRVYSYDASYRAFMKAR